VDEEVVDESAKAAFEQAKQSFGEAEATKMRLEEAIRELDTEIKDAGSELLNLCQAYGEVALVGSFGSYLQSNIQILSLRLQTKVKESAPQAEIDRLKSSLEVMNLKYEVVSNNETKKLTRAVVIHRGNKGGKSWWQTIGLKST
jgi:multidrug resistance efflux pump